MAKCTKGACCSHLRYTSSITMLTTKEYETCIFYPTCVSEHTPLLTNSCFTTALSFALLSQSEAKKIKAHMPPYLAKCTSAIL